MDALTVMKQALEALESANTPNNFYTEEENNLRAVIKQMEKALNSLRKDAERYRWLRNCPTDDLPLGSFGKLLCMGQLDSAIDKAIGENIFLEDIDSNIIPAGVLHIRDGGIVASSIKDPLENGDYYIIKNDLSD